MIFKKCFFLLCLLSLMACQHQDANINRQDIRFGIAQAPINLDPRYATDAAGEWLDVSAMGAANLFQSPQALWR